MQRMVPSNWCGRATEFDKEHKVRNPEILSLLTVIIVV
jgi:hypothetical protein